MFIPRFSQKNGGLLLEQLVENKKKSVSHSNASIESPRKLLEQGKEKRESELGFYLSLQTTGDTDATKETTAE